MSSKDEGAMMMDGAITTMEVMKEDMKNEMDDT